MNGQDATTDNTASLIRIPGYSIKRVLGRGGMATVYLAIQESLGREVALKVLDPNQAQGKQFSERFLREARIVSHLTHPNIVTVFDVGVYEGYHYLSMEYITGRDLRDACGDISRKELIRIIKDVARALNFAAKKGYVHRDVKPENIMLHEGDGRVVLMDFGIARSYQTSHGLTRAGSALGTPYYMSPEQNKGLSADHRSDIYSLGVVFFHMLSGYVPYDANSAVAIGIKHITATIPVLSDELQIFQPIINTCLAKEPEDRYQTAAELIEALDKISDEDLAAIEAKCAAFQEAGKNHHAETLISSGTNSGTSFSASKDIHTPELTQAPRERTSFFVFLLLLLTLAAGAVAYQQRQEILRYAETLNIPWLTQTIEKLRLTQASVAKSIEAPAQPDAILDTIQNAARENASNIAAEKEKKKLDYIDKIQSAINSGNPAQALTLMAEMQEQYPRVASEQKFVQTREQLQAKLQQAQALPEHLARARKYFESGAIITAEKNNALSELEAVLKLDPSNAEALKMLQDINQFWLKKAKQQASSWRLRKQLKKLDGMITQLNIQHPFILKQQKKLQQVIHHIARVKNLLQQADEAFNKNQLISPADNNAYSRYQKVLAIEAHNRHAKEKLKEIETRLTDQITQAIEQGRLTQASIFLEQAQSVYGHSNRIVEIESMLEKAIAATQPQVSRILFSATPLQSLDQPQAETLQPGRTLYIGFHFKNMENTSTLLQAVLLDGAGQIQISQKPVIVSGAEGDHFFQIDQPVEGFSEGSYILELRLGNKRLLSQPFLVNNFHQP